MKKIAIAFVIFASSLCAQVQLGKNVQIGGDTTHPWQASFTFLGVPANGQIMLLIPSTVAITIPSGCAGSYMGATVSATATADITIVKHAGGPTGASTTLCTAEFAASATTATFSGSGGTLAAGDYLEILGPATADATLANLGGGIYATR